MISCKQLPLSQTQVHPIRHHSAPSDPNFKYSLRNRYFKSDTVNLYKCGCKSAIGCVKMCHDNEYENDCFQT